MSYLTVGIHQIDAERYHGDPCEKPSLSSTLAKKMIQQSPLHAWTASSRLNPNFEPVEKKTFDIGRAAHRVILGKGEEFSAIPEEYLASNGAASTKAAKDFIADCRYQNVTPLKQSELDAVYQMANSVRSRLGALGITINPAYSEQVAIAEIDGVMCRAMLDYVPLGEDWMLDIKTTTDASPEACIKAVQNYAYDVQDAHYRETWLAASGERRRFRFCFVEKEPPYEVCVIELADGDAIMGVKKIARAREIWGLCLRNNNWPGYPIGIHQVALSDWYHERWLERESVEADHKRETGKDVYNRVRDWMAPENHKRAGE
ncbi:PD-(D/E)XK nuclease-like domain-containing protein [Celeribacter sp. SCSIO 80788]|uniref:PD-(D/E)XK nuclease-like domain-containing protein n=1 Tax=Celeribacter sp. SCSIO 80788 TaxID=3117013 RepID=UPI003DA64361